MSCNFVVPFPFLHSTPYNDESPSDPPSSTPRASFVFLLDPPNSRHDNDLHRRSRSLASVDSGYFSMGKESPISKGLSRKSSVIDLPYPLSPINGASDPTQESPKSQGVIKSFLKKTKRSIASPSMQDFDPFVTSVSPRSSADDRGLLTQPAPFSLPSPRSSPRNPSLDVFEQQPRFIERRGMKYHPYSRVDAPYMLSYDRILLDNDEFSEILLRRLNHNHSPSFHDFTHAVPRSILDLGCGPGRWAVEAAEFWQSSQVIGFDLIDPARMRGGAESPSNVQWKQGNFVKDKLPFPKHTFDLVRMANLSFCIPHGRWEHVLSEVRRVLAHGGRLELIDDYLHFPYIKHPPRPPEDFSSLRRPPPSFGDNGGDRAVECIDIKCDDNDDNDDDDDDFVSTKSRLSSLVDVDDFPSQPAYDPVSDWNRNVDNSKALEKLFEDMLSCKFSIDPRPSKFLDQVMDKIFGRHNQRRLHEFNLYLAPPLSQDSDNSSVGSLEGPVSASIMKAGKDFAKWVTHIDKEKEKKLRTKGDRSSEGSMSDHLVLPDMNSTRAAYRPGTESAPSYSHPTQSPGLILWPATFIPVTPFELEMHACKHLHSLIGSKAALTEFLGDIAREQELPFDQQMVDDAIWDYESFRRKRFNWPSECPDSHHEVSVPLATTSRSITSRNSLEGPYQIRPCVGSNAPPEPLFPREKLDFVRSIRVYGATKADEEIHVS